MLAVVSTVVVALVGVFVWHIIRVHKLKEHLNSQFAVYEGVWPVDVRINPFTDTVALGVEVEGLEYDMIRDLMASIEPSFQTTAQQALLNRAYNDHDLYAALVPYKVDVDFQSPPVRRSTHVRRSRARGVADPGTAQVDRVWSEYGFAYALVSYENTTDSTFEHVTIECVALGPNGQRLGVEHRSWFAHSDGLIQPGFTGVKEVPVELHGATAESMSCSVSARE